MTTHLLKRHALIGTWLLVVCLTGCGRNLSEQRERHFLRGQKYMQNHKYSEAAIEFENVVHIDPKYPEGFLALGLTSRQLGRYDEAVRAFRRSLEINPAQSQAAIELGEIYLTDRNPSQARVLAQEVLARDENALGARILLAKSYLAKKDFSMARDEFEKARQLSAHDPTICLAIGLTEIGLGNFAAAEANFRTAIQLDPARAESYQNLANLYTTHGLTADAEKVLGEGARANPDNLQLQLTLADFYLRTQKGSQAEALIELLEKSETDRARRLMDIGDFWLAHSEVSRAIKEYQASHAIRDNPLVIKKLVSAYIALGDPENAARWNEKLVRANDQDHEARMFDGAIAYLQGRNKDAAVRLQTIVNDDPASLFAHYYLGSTFAAQGRLEAAKAEFSSCLKLNDKFLHAYLKLGELSLQRNDAHGAAEYAKSVIALDPRLLDGYLLAADAALASMDKEEAGKALLRAARIAGQDYRVHERWAELYALEKNDVDAKREIEVALSSKSNPVEPLTGITRSYVRRKKFSEGTGTETLETLVATHGGNSAAYELLARLYLSQSRPSEAAAACRRSLAIDPRRVDALFCLAESLAGLGKDAEAEQAYARAIALQPEQASVYMEIASFYYRRADFSRASEFYHQALRIDPDSPATQAGMARILAETGQDLDLALSLAQRAKQQLPQSSEVLETLAWVYHKKGVNDLAASLLKECTSKDKENPLCQYDLGMLQLQNGGIQQGRDLLSGALKNGLSPPFEFWAKQTLASLPR